MSKKILSVPQALHDLHKGLAERIERFEQKCVELRKAEVAKDDSVLGHTKSGKAVYKPSAELIAAHHKWAMTGTADKPIQEAYHKLRDEHMTRHADFSSADHKEAAQLHHDAAIDAHVAKDKKLDNAHSVVAARHAQAARKLDMTKDEMPADDGGMEMSEKEPVCKACGMAKCDCDKAEKWAKGEMPAGSSPDYPGKKVGVLPGDKKSAEPVDGEEGSGGKIIAKAGMGMGAPKAPGAPKPMGGAPKMPGASGGMPAAPKSPMGKPPAMGAGQPNLKSELTKAALPTTRDQKAQAAKLPGVRASVGKLMDTMGAAPAPAPKPAGGLVGQTLSLKPIASNPTQHAAPAAPGARSLSGLAPPPMGARPMVKPFGKGEKAPKKK